MKQKRQKNIYILNSVNLNCIIYAFCIVLIIESVLLLSQKMIKKNIFNKEEATLLAKHKNSYFLEMYCIFPIYGKFIAIKKRLVGEIVQEHFATF